MKQRIDFLDIKREEGQAQDESSRICHWNEFTTPLTLDEQQQQALRCMHCGTPFCHDNCPLHNNVPEWNEYVHQGNWKMAYQRLIKSNPFPEFTARVCPALCEGSCTLGLIGPMVTVKANEYTVIEKAFEKGYVLPKIPQKRTGKKVVVVGSGPSGLACAHTLNQMGHSVSLYERASKPGGLLMYGIPNMKLDKSIIDRRMALLEQEGIQVQCNITVGKDRSFEQLSNEFDAIILACGSTTPRDLPIPGRNGDGILFAVDYLSSCTHQLQNENSHCTTAKDKDVVVIGGGDTGNDCVASALRQGAKSIQQFEILPKPPTNRSIDNPWPEYPRTLKTDYGQKEHIALFGCDPRIYSISTKRFLLDEDQTLTGLETVGVEWRKSSDGRFQPLEIPNTKKTHDAQLVLLAMGFVGPDQSVLEHFDLQYPFSLNTFVTKHPHVFVTGDMHRGQSLVAYAIDEGIHTAQACNKYLQPTYK